MTTVYFIRHAEADNSILDGRIRPLTKKGMDDCALVTSFLQDKNIDVVLSSPYKRAVETVRDFANEKGLQVLSVEGFKEHETISDNYPSDEYFAFIREYWADFRYKVPNDESLSDVQERNITALNTVLCEYENKNIVIGTHGTALSTIINYYDASYGFDGFLAMVKIKPWVVRMDFNKDRFVEMEKIDLFSRPQLFYCQRIKVRV